ncbi:MAG: DUF1488 family protein [Burkholderiaceae bacterium]|nr:DUF1488 family protein [Burkholderiaceae bacterium]
MTVNQHESPQAVLRFNADIGTERVTAFISHSALSARYGGIDEAADMRAVVSEHRSEIDAAIARRIQAGARQPVVLRASDLCLPHTMGFVAGCCI